jgi:hypothetical protein
MTHIIPVIIVMVGRLEAIPFLIETHCGQIQEAGSSDVSVEG